MKSENSEFLKKKRKGRILTFLRILHFENYVFVFLDFMNPHPWRKNSEFSECKILKNLFFFKSQNSYFLLFPLCILEKKQLFDSPYIMTTA